VRRAPEEAIDDRAEAQQAALLFGLPAELDLTVRGIEDVLDFLPRHALDPEQMPVQWLGGAFLHELELYGASFYPATTPAKSAKAASTIVSCGRNYR
jgi:hypothetical protein